jgi:hypothetical protein
VIRIGPIVCDDEGPGTHFVELVDQGHDRALAVFHDLQVRVDVAAPKGGGCAGTCPNRGEARPPTATIAATIALCIINERRSDPAGGSETSSSGIAKVSGERSRVHSLTSCAGIRPPNDHEGPALFSYRCIRLSGCDRAEAIRINPQETLINAENGCVSTLTRRAVLNFNLFGRNDVVRKVQERIPAPSHPRRVNIKFLIRSRADALVHWRSEAN